MLKTFISNVMFSKDNFITSFLQLINALEVAINGRPKITGIELHASTGFVSKTIKSTGKMNLSTCTNTSSTIPLGTFTDLSSSKRVTEEGFNSPRLRLCKTEYGSKFTLAQR